MKRPTYLPSVICACIFPLSIALLLIEVVQPASAAPLYNIVPLGLDDLEHTRNDGYKISLAGYSNEYHLNEAGQVYGYAYRFNGGSTQLGQSVWLYDGATTIKIGLTGAEHTRNDGYKSSEAFQLNEAGQVLGYSYRYNGGSTDMGYSAWLYDGATTIELGLTGSEYTRNDGYKSSAAYWLNKAGQTVGYSTRYNGGSTILGNSAWLYDGATTIDIGLTGPEHYESTIEQLNEAGQVRGWSRRSGGGLSAWVYDGATTIEVGLTGTEYTRNDGYKYSQAYRLNEAGQVSGSSQRYNGGSTDLGRSAWLYDGATTIEVGLTGTEYTRNDGYKSSVAYKLNEAGQVRGLSRRYNGGSAFLGYSAWLYDGATTIDIGDIGLTGAEHTSNDGYKGVGVRQLNEAGQILGYSARYNGGSTYLGDSVWLYDGATTIDIGLTGAEHTRNNGYKYSEDRHMNEAGQVFGVSYRYNGRNTELGRSVWLYDGATTIDIGLTGPEHTSSSGYKYSDAKEFKQLNEAGQVIGWSYRYNGGTNLGQDAWLYDPTLDQTFALNLSTRSDGYAYSSATYLGEDGLVLGSYTLFDALDNDLGGRAFYFTIADGLHDLGSLVEGGLDVNGWDSLYIAIRANGLGQILGHGFLTPQSAGIMSYLLTPVTPLPGDVNFDGVVDIFDINLLSAHWGETGSAGDANGDMILDIFDINMISSNWTPTGGAGSAATAVPEPATWLLTIVAASAVCLPRRRSTRMPANRI